MYGVSLDYNLSNAQVWVLGVVVVFTMAYRYLTKTNDRRLPPAAPALPLVGSLPFLGMSDIREPLMKMRRKYGDVFSIFVGPNRFVLINGYDAIYEALVKNGHVFAGRPDTFVFKHLFKGYGVVSSQGDLWREQRRYSLHVLRDFGFGRTVLEDRILEEVGYFIEEMANNTSKPFYPQPLLQKSVANVIVSVVFGKRMDYDDPIFTNYVNILNRTIAKSGNSGIVNAFPFLRFIPGDPFRLKKLVKEIDYLNSEHARIIEEHKQAAKKGKAPDDFITVYLKKIEEEKTQKNTTFTERQLVGICTDLFAAGTETTSTTLAWAIIYMSLNQDVQARVHADIDDIIGRKAMPRMEHRSELPYIEACLLEVQRIGDIVPLGVPHCVTEDVNLRGYFISKGTTVLPILHSVHCDPDLWPEPAKFKPERFLNEQGKVDKKQMIPFSLGKRICLGESLAKMELFLYFTSMMQRFRFKIPDGFPLPDTKGVIGVTNMPKPFHVVVEARM